MKSNSTPSASPLRHRAILLAAGILVALLALWLGGGQSRNGSAQPRPERSAQAPAADKAASAEGDAAAQAAGAPKGEAASAAMAGLTAGDGGDDGPFPYGAELNDAAEAAWVAFRKRFPEADLTERDDFNQAVRAVREDYPVHITAEGRESYAGWVREVESVRAQLIEARARAKGLALRGTTEDGRAFLLTGFEDDAPVYIYTANREAAESTAANLLRDNSSFDSPFSGSVDGGGFHVIIQDGGNVYTHNEFRNRDGTGMRTGNVRGSVSGTSGDQHATHVAGTIAARGADSRAKGMAPGVRLYSFLGLGYGDVLDYGRVWPDQSTHAIIGNASLQSEQDFGLYATEDRQWDSVMFDTPYFLHFYASGNVGPGYYTIGAGIGAVSKNTMTVGNTHDASRDGAGNLTGGGGIYTGSFASSRGPMIDGRIKPDIVGNGVSVYSSYFYDIKDPFFGTLIDRVETYMELTGTSMASPNAAGSAVLLQDYYSKRFSGGVMRASTLMALIIHSADDRGNPGPDYTYGWGLMNTIEAARIIRTHADHPERKMMVEARLDQDALKRYTYTATGNEPLRATLAWTDVPGEARSSTGDRSPNLVNDLNVRWIGPNGEVRHPYVMPFVTGSGGTPAFSNSLLEAYAKRGVNTTDNKLRIDVPNPAEGNWTLEVSHAGGLTGGYQDFSLVLSGIHAAIDNPPVVRSNTPEGLLAETKAPIEVLGYDFQAGAQVWFERSGQASVAASVTNVTPTRIEAELDHRGMAAGAWQVVVQNPDGQKAISPVAYQLGKGGLRFDLLPATTTSGTTLAPVELRALFASGTPNTTYSGPVTLSLDGDGSLGGTLTVNAVAGLARFENLVLTGGGDFRLVAGGAGFVPATSGVIHANFPNPPRIVSHPVEGLLAEPEVTLEVLGDYFKAGAQVWLRRSGEPSVAATVVDVTPTRIEATLDHRGMAAGEWSLVVRNVDGRETVSPESYRLGQGGLRFDASPTTTTSGTTLAPVELRALYPSGTANTTYSGPVTLSLDGDGTLGGTLKVNAVGGLARFEDLVLTGGGDFRLVADGAGFVPATSGVIHANFPNPPRILSHTGEGLLAEAEVTLEVLGDYFKAGAQVWLRRSGEPDVAATVVDVTPTRIQATLDPRGMAAGEWSLAVRNVDGRETVSPEGYQLGGGLRFDLAPATTTSGTTLAPVELRALYPSGTANTTYSGPVTLSLDGDGTLGGTLTVNAVAGLARFEDLVLTGGGDFRLVADGAGFVPATSGVIHANFPNPPRIVSHPVEGLVAEPEVTLEVRGDYFEAGAQVWLRRSGETDVAATVVDVTSTRIQATLDHRGMAAGEWSLVVGNVDGRETVSPEAYQLGEGGLRFDALPGTAASGDLLPAVEVRVLYPSGAPNTTYSGPVTLSLDGDGALAGTLTVNAVAGLARFEDLVLTGAGTYRLVAGGAGFATATSTAFRSVSLTGLLVPQYIQGGRDASGENVERVPYAWRVRLEGLVPGAGYRVAHRAVRAGEPAGSGGAGHMLVVGSAGEAWQRLTAEPSLAAADAGEAHFTITADAGGTYTGWFVTEPTGDARFTPGNELRFRLLLNDGRGGDSVAVELTTGETAQVLGFGPAAGEGTAVLGEWPTSLESPHLAVLYAEADGSGRPLAATPVEPTGAGIDSRYAPFYQASVAPYSNRWGTILPNHLDTGLQRVAYLEANAGANEVDALTEAGGFAGTVASSGGLASPVYIGIEAVPISVVSQSVDPGTVSTGRTHMIDGLEVAPGDKLILALSWTDASMPLSVRWQGSQFFTSASARTTGSAKSALFYLDGAAAGGGAIEVSFDQSTSLRAGAVAVEGLAPGVGRTTNGAGGLRSFATDVPYALVVGAHTAGGGEVLSGPFENLLYRGADAAPPAGAGFRISSDSGTRSYAWTGTTDGTLTLAAFPAAGDRPSLRFDLSPSQAVSGEPLGPVTVRVEDARGELAGNYRGPVTLSLEGTGMLEGTRTVNAAYGLATFDDLVLTGSGAHRLVATVEGLDPAAGPTFALLRLTELLVPRYMQGMPSGAAGNAERVPYAWRARLEGLKPGATYRIAHRAVQAADPAAGSGAGVRIAVNPGGDWRRLPGEPGFTAAEEGSGHATFTADLAGTYTGWFVTEPDADARFTAGNELHLRLLLNDGAGGEQVAHVFTTAQSARVLAFGSGPGEGTAVIGESTGAPAGSMAVLYAEGDGSGRPLAATPVEATGAVIDPTYAAFYRGSVMAHPRQWGTILPNDLAGGLRRVDYLSPDAGAALRDSLVEATGFADTALATGGLDRPIWLNATASTLIRPQVLADDPARISSGIDHRIDGIAAEAGDKLILALSWTDASMPHSVRWQGSQPFAYASARTTGSAKSALYYLDVLETGSGAIEVSFDQATTLRIGVVAVEGLAPGVGRTTNASGGWRSFATEVPYALVVGVHSAGGGDALSGPFANVLYHGADAAPLANAGFRATSDPGSQAYAWTGTTDGTLALAAFPASEAGGFDPVFARPAPDTWFSGAPLDPVQVRIEDQDGLRVTTYHGPVTLSLEGTGMLGGTRTVDAADGLATFDDLVLTGSGTHRLVASVEGLDPATGLWIFLIESGYDQWRAANFPDPAELGDDQVSGPSAVSGGMENVLRYALGVGRYQRPDGRMPYLTENAASYRFPMDSSKTDIVYRVRASSDLADWSEVLYDSSQAGQPAPVDGWVDVPVQRERDRLFLRLEVESK